MPDAVDAHALASAARDVMRADIDGAAGVRPRAAAMLARQGLERALQRLWAVTAPGLERTPMRCQLLCAGPMLNDLELGGRVAAAWNALSGACHHRAYDLPMTAGELNSALDVVWQLAEATEKLRGRIAVRGES